MGSFAEYNKAGLDVTKKSKRRKLESKDEISHDIHQEEPRKVKNNIKEADASRAVADTGPLVQVACHTKTASVNVAQNEQQHKKNKKHRADQVITADAVAPAESINVSEPAPDLPAKEHRHKKYKKRQQLAEAETPLSTDSGDQADTSTQVADHTEAVANLPHSNEQRHKKSKKRPHPAEEEAEAETPIEVANHIESAPDLVAKDKKHKKSKKLRHMAETEVPISAVTAEVEEVATQAADHSEPVSDLPDRKERRHKKSKKQVHAAEDTLSLAGRSQLPATTLSRKEQNEARTLSDAEKKAPAAAAAAPTDPAPSTKSGTGEAQPAAKEKLQHAPSTASVSSTSVLPPPVAPIPNCSPRAVPAPFRGAAAPVSPYVPKPTWTSSSPAIPQSAPRPFIPRPPYRPGGVMPANQFGSRQWAPNRFTCPTTEFHRRLATTFPPCPKTLKVLRPIGQGNYARVFEAMDEFPAENGMQERRVCTVKQIPTAHDWTIFEALRLQEAQNVPNVIQCFGCYYEPQRREIWIATERMDGSVLDVLLSSFPLPEAMIADVAHQTLHALRGLHKLNLVHMDVKPANILYRRLMGHGTGMEFKLADFGCVQDQRNGEIDEIGEFTYMSPEVILHQPRTTSTDIWNLGVTLLHLADGEPPLNGWDDNLRVQLIAHTTLCPQLKEPQRWSPDLVDFISRCLTKDFRFRPDATALLDHPLFQRHGLK